MKFDLALIWLHLCANLFWIGAITAVSLVMLGGPATQERGKIAHDLYLKLAVPAFALSFLGGVGRLAMDAAIYFKQPWMHAKLTVALIAIALHHVLGARARKMAAGEASGSVKVLVAVFAACAIAAAFFVLFKIPGR